MIKEYFNRFGRNKTIVVKSQKEFDELVITKRRPVMIKIDFGDIYCPALINRVFPGCFIVIEDRYAYVRKGASIIYAGGKSYIKAYDDVYIDAYDDVTIELYNDAWAFIKDNVKATSHDNAKVICHRGDSVNVTAYDNSYIRANKYSSATINIRHMSVTCEVEELSTSKFIGITCANIKTIYT